MFEIDDDELRESYERQQSVGIDAKQTAALLNSLIEQALNAETDPIKRLRIAGDALTAQSRIAATLRKNGLDSGEYVDRQAAMTFLKLVTRALMNQIKPELSQEAYFDVCDSFPLAIFDLASSDESIRRFLFSDSAWADQQAKYTGEARAVLETKLIKNRGR